MFMNRQIQGEAIPAVDVVDTPESLAGIRRPEVAGVLWNRHPHPTFNTWIEALDPARLPSARVILTPAAVREELLAICSTTDTPDCEMRDWLIDDISALADRFAQIMAAPYLRLLLDVVTGNACRRFHVDALTARLICTYRGQGPQYGIGTDGSEPEHPLQVPTGAPFVLRGTLWPETPRSGLLHRSPPIEGTGETRLLLVLDPIHDLDDEDAY